MDAHLQYPLQDSGTMYPYLLEKVDYVPVLSITCVVRFLGTSNFYIIFIFSNRVFIRSFFNDYLNRMFYS